jgi:hypothetical protein
VGDEETTIKSKQIENLLPILYETLSDSKYSVIRQQTIDVFSQMASAAEGEKRSKRKEIVFNIVF